MRGLAYVAIVCAALASLATSAPEDGVGPDAGPELARFWSAYSPPFEATLELEPGDRITYSLEARLEGDLDVLEESHNGYLSIAGLVSGVDSGPTSLTIEIADDAGVIAAETIRWRGESDLRTNVPFPTDECPRQRGETCVHEFEVTFAAEESAAHLDWTARLIASGTLERPARVSIRSVVDAEPL